MADRFIPRLAEEEILKRASFFPAVAVVGPRQVGKTSLVKALRTNLPKPSVYLDLENPDDLVKLQNPGLFLDTLTDHTVILDEIQKVPSLFPALRGIIDKDRKPGRFILLGSASPDLIRDSSESLAGRIAYLELKPFIFEEIQALYDFRTHWFRGGFPDALLAPDDALSGIWRQNFIRTYLERDLPLLGLSADPTTINKLWRMAAHLSGDLLNMETLARSLALSGTTIRRYLDFLESAFLIRRLPPFSVNLKKRLVKSPKLYIRDTGILHQLLGISSFFDLSGHPAIGASWESYIIEQIAANLPDWAEMYFYRTHEGTEADLVIARAGQPEILLEIKYSAAPKASKGFHIAAADLGVKKQYIVCPVEQGFPISERTRVLSYREIGILFL